MNNRMDSEHIDWGAELDANVGWLQRIVYARVGDYHAVEDVIQELGVAATSWPKTLCGPAAVNRWLYAAAVKQALMFCRSRIRDRKREKKLAIEIESQSRNVVDPMRMLIASENVEWMRMALKRLPARQREVLLLKHFESWSCQQIADKFGIAVSTVQRHLLNARKRLRKELMRIENEK